MSSNTPAPEGKNNPVSVRIEGEDRKALHSLLPEHGTTTGALLAGLRLLADTHKSEMPLYPRLVDEEEIVQAIDEAAAAACEVLDRLFEGKPPESMGISSNFRGGLMEHLEAMLMGRPAARRSTRLMLKPLFGDSWSLGRITRSAEKNEGWCIVKLPTKFGQEPEYFHSDRNRFVPLERVTADTLFTSDEDAVKAAFDWMRKEELSPRDVPLRLCLLAWDPNTEGPLTVSAQAA